MEEVDKIIFQNLKSLGWEPELHTNEDLKSLDVTDIAKGISKCILAISEDYDVSSSLPHNMAQRFRAAASLAEVIKDLGYIGDVGYQTILYPSEHDLRKIFMFLIEKLPKESTILHKEPLGRKDYLLKRTKVKVTEALKRPWVPPHCLQVARMWKATESPCDDIPLAQCGTLHCCSFTTSPQFDKGSLSLTEGKKLLSEVFSQISARTFYPSILYAYSLIPDHAPPPEKVERPGDVSASLDLPTNEKLNLNLLPMSENLLKFLSNERRIRTLHPLTQPSDDASFIEQSHHIPQTEELANKNKQIMIDKQENYQREIQEMSSNIKEIDENLNKCCQIIREIEEESKDTNEKLFNEEKNLENLKKASLLTADPLESIERLKLSLIASRSKEEKFSSQWIEYKRGLQNQLEELDSLATQNKSKKQEILEEIAEVRSQMKNLGLEAIKKQSLLVQLKQQHELLPKGINRGVYTKRILDISSKVRKQKTEIEKVIGDIKVVQKEINNLTGKLERTFAVIEDASFKSANSNEKARPIYRTIVSIHDTCGELLDIIRETGITQREVAEFKIQLDAEKNKKVEEILHQIQEDLSNVKEENSLINKKLSSL